MLLFPIITYIKDEMAKRDGRPAISNHNSTYTRGLAVTKNQVPKSQEKVKGCLVPWCDGKHSAKGYCDKHYMQVTYRGAIFLRTRQSPNHYEINGDVCFISLYDRKCNVVARAVIDSSDVIKCKSRKWHLGSRGYVASSSPTPIRLSNFLFDHKANHEIVIDHKNGNKLDNRRSSNLRFCTYSQNTVNTPMRLDNTSGTKGVSYHKQTNKWRAYIHHHKIQRHLGLFIKKFNAIKARKEAELKYHGDFAWRGIIP